MRYVNIAGYIAIPLAFLVHFWLAKGKSWEPTLTFVLAAAGVIPLAHLMGESTEHLAEKTGPTLGGLLNATCGNAAEIIIGVIALTKGLNEIVQASLTGSILGNLLLVGGASMVAGGWRREKQTFSQGAAEANAGLLLLATAAMLMPAIFHHTAKAMHDRAIVEHELSVSHGTAFILLAVYALGLLFTLRTHKHIFSTGPAPSPEHKGGLESHAPWSVKKSVIVLLLASAGIAVVAELLVGSAEHMAKVFGWNHVFVGVILLAIIGNAAEHSTAIMLALRDDMDTAMTIVYQSSIQIALFATPFLLLLSWGFVGVGLQKGAPMSLVFSPMEVAAVVITVLVVAILCQNGETNWFEGMLLLALYAVLAVGFFYTPQSHPGGVQSDGSGMPATAPAPHR